MLKYTDFSLDPMSAWLAQTLHCKCTHFRPEYYYHGSTSHICRTHSQKNSI